MASEPLKVLGSQSLVGEVTGTAGMFWVACGQAFWVANVWASKAMAATKSPPASGSGAKVVLVVAKGLLAVVDTGGRVAQVSAYLKASQ